MRLQNDMNEQITSSVANDLTLFDFTRRYIKLCTLTDGRKK